MSSNDKSDIGIQNAISSGSKRISQIIYLQPDEGSLPYSFEQPEGSLPYSFEQPDGSLPYAFEQMDGSVPYAFQSSVMIPLLSFQNLGHNKNYSQRSPVIHELQNLTNTNNVDALSIIPDIQLDKYGSDAVIACDTELDKYSFEFVSLSMYKYSDSENPKYDIEHLKLNYSPQDIYDDTSDVFFPKIPISFGSKKISSISDHKTYYASNPVMLPIMKKVANNTGSVNEMVYAHYSIYPLNTIHSDGSTQFRMAYTAGRYSFFMDCLNEGYAFRETLISEFNGVNFYAKSVSTAFLGIQVLIVTTYQSGYTPHSYVNMNFQSPHGTTIPTLSSSLTTAIGANSYNAAGISVLLAKDFLAYGAISARSALLPDIDSGSGSVKATYAKFNMKHPRYKESDRCIKGLKITDISFDTGDANPALLVSFVAFDKSNSKCYAYHVLTISDSLVLQMNSLDFPIVGLSIKYITDYTDSAVTDIIPQALTISADIINYTCNKSSHGALTNSGGAVTPYATVTSVPTSKIVNDNGFIYDHPISGILSTMYRSGYEMKIHNSAIVKSSSGIYTGMIAIAVTTYGTPLVVNSLSVSGIGSDIIPGSIGLRSLNISPIPKEIQFDLSLYSKYKWEKQADGTEPTGWYTQTVFGNSSFGNSEVIPDFENVYLSKQSMFSSSSIYDPALASGRIANYFRSQLCSSGSEYNYREVFSGIANVYDDTDTSKITDQIDSYIGILNNKSSGDVYDIIIDSDIIYSGVSIKKILKITETLTLTQVRYEYESEYYYYIGILNEETLRHYSPKNIHNNASSSEYVFEKITILEQSDNGCSLILNMSSERKYVVFTYIKNIPGSIYIPEDNYDDFVLSVYTINDSDEIDDTELVKYSDESNLGYGLLKSEAVRKSVGIIEHDQFVSVKNRTSFRAELADLSIITKPSSMIFQNAVTYINEAVPFASNCITIPMLSPSYMFGIPGPDAIKPADGSVSVSNVAEIYYRANRIMLQDFSNHNTPADAFSCSSNLLIMQLPSIDRNIKSYSMIPEKLSTYFGMDRIMSFNIGSNSFIVNSKPYVEYKNNLYMSSISRLTPAGPNPLLTSYGTIFVTGNLVCSANENGTYIYRFDQYGITLEKILTGKMLTDAIRLSEDYIIVCNNGIYSVRYDMLYEFPEEISKAVIKPVYGNGFMLLTNADVSQVVRFKVLVGGVHEYFSVTPSSREIFSFEYPYTTGLYQISYNSTISKIDLSSIETEYINCDLLNVVSRDNNLQMIDKTIDYSSGNMIVAVKQISYNTNIPSEIYILTGPIHYRGQQADQVFDIKSILVEYEGAGTAVLYIKKGTTVLYTDSSITLSAASKEVEIYFGSATAEGISFEFAVNPSSLSFKILNLKAIGEFTDIAELT